MMAKKVLTVNSRHFFDDMKKILNNLGYKKDDILLITPSSILASSNKKIIYPHHLIEFEDGSNEIKFVNAVDKFKKVGSIVDDDYENIIELYETSDSYEIRISNISVDVPKLIDTEFSFIDYEKLINDDAGFELVYKNTFKDKTFSKFLNLSKSADSIEFFIDRESAVLYALRAEDLTLRISDNIDEETLNSNSFKLEFTQILGIKYPEDEINVEIYRNDYDYLICISFTSSAYKTKEPYVIKICDLTNVAIQQEEVIL